MKNQLIPASDFDRHREVWDRVNREQHGHILLDSRFVAPLIRHFASSDTRLCVSETPAGPNLLLLRPGRHGSWETFQPSQAPLGLVLFAVPANAVRDARRVLRDLPGWATALAVLRQDPDLSPFVELRSFRAVEEVEYIQTARLSLDGSYDEYWKARGRNLKHNLARQRRRLENKQVRLELAEDRSPEAIARRIEEFGGLEESGWKGREGSAVTATNRQGRFYREMLEEFCASGEAVVYRLLLDGRTAACDLCLERNGTLFILKTAYDESVKKLSCGLLLHQEIVRALYRQKRVTTIEFYGQVRDWHEKFTKDIRTMYHVNVYRNAVVRRIRVLLKRVLNRSPRGRRRENLD
jgi:CelD/BcsL family acetyltransferase involved in cellulose biosynthesis